ncbi:MAG TPA: universal stress protein, partial [Synergistales bacterium]|nr:universal stress protein [Synergistales bacterium]
MLKKILVCVDMTRMADHLIEYGHTLAHRLGAEVTFINVLPSSLIWKGYGTWVNPDWSKEAEESARKKIRYLIKLAEDKHPDLPKDEHEILVAQGNSAEVIIETAKKNDFNLIVIGFKSVSGIPQLM